MTLSLPERLALEQPTLLDSIAVVSRSIDRDHPVAATFAIACGSCGHAYFSGWLRVVELGSAEVEPIGVEVQCEGCLDTQVLFDARLHGYDGELGHLRWIKGPDRRGERLNGGRLFHPQVTTTFNTEEIELAQIAAEGSSRVVDLFDWFILADADAPESELFERECA